MYSTEVNLGPWNVFERKHKYRTVDPDREAPWRPRGALHFEYVQLSLDLPHTYLRGLLYRSHICITSLIRARHGKSTST